MYLTLQETLQYVFVKKVCRPLVDENEESVLINHAEGELVFLVHCGNKSWWYNACNRT